MNIPDEAVRAAQNYLIQHDWRVPYGTVLGALQTAGHATYTSSTDKRRALTPERLTQIDTQTNELYYPDIDWAMSAIADLLDHIDALNAEGAG